MLPIDPFPSETYLAHRESRPTSAPELKYPSLFPLSHQLSLYSSPRGPLLSLFMQVFTAKARSLVPGPRRFLCETSAEPRSASSEPVYHHLIVT